jgi:small-conductance mechanosensitive channel
MISTMLDAEWFTKRRFPLLGHDISAAGIAAFVACFLAGLILSSILQSERVRNWLTKTGLGKNLVGMITSALSLFGFVTLVVLGVEFAGIPIPWSRPIPGLGLSALQVIDLVIVLVVVLWFSSTSRTFILNRFLAQSGLDRSLQYALAQVIGYVALGVGLVIALQTAGINLSGLAVFAGALGVGLGLGLQTVASNFISGLVILAERPIKIGDRVTINSTSGTVQSIRVRATTLLTNDNIAVIIPNSMITGGSVTNWSYGGPSVRFRVPVTVAYGNDAETIRECLLAAAKEHPEVLPKPEPTVFLEGFAENLITFQLVVWTESMSYRPARFRSDLNFAIEKRLRAAGVQKFGNKSFS